MRTLFVVCLFALLLSACGQPQDWSAPRTDTSDILPDAGSETIGIEAAPANVKEWGRSIVRIERAEGGYGSGFFISPRVIATNHHVLPRTRCGQDLCQGVMAIRGFYPGGENQVFYRLRPLGFNKTLDFALFEVLDGAAPVEGLALATMGEGAALENHPLLVLGHPLSSPLKVSSARVVSTSEGEILLESAIIFGNSGGPLLHAATGKVLGIVSAIAHDASSYELGTRQIAFRAKALESSALMNALYRDYPGTRSTLRWDPSHFSPAPRRNKSLFSWLSEPISTERFFAGVLGRLTPVLDHLEEDPDARSEMESFLEQTILFDLKRGTKTAVTPETLKEVMDLLPRSVEAKRFKYFHDDKAQAICVTTTLADSGQIDTLGRQCHQTQMKDGADILHELRTKLAALRCTEALGHAVVSLLEVQLLLRTELSPTVVEDVNALLAQIAPAVKRGMGRARLEALQTLWTHQRSLLLKGGFAASFSR